MKNKVLIAGKIVFTHKINKHSFLTIEVIETIDQKEYKSQIKCAAFDKSLNFSVGQFVQINGRINAWYDKVNKISNQNVQILKITLISQNSHEYFENDFDFSQKGAF